MQSNHWSFDGYAILPEVEQLIRIAGRRFFLMAVGHPPFTLEEGPRPSAPWTQMDLSEEGDEE